MRVRLRVHVCVEERGHSSPRSCRTVTYVVHLHLHSPALSSLTQSYHGVSFNEISKLHAMAYSWNGDKSYLNTSLNAFKMMVEFDLQVRW